MAFSGDGRLLLAQGAGPNWPLCLWAWEKSKLLGSVRSVAQPGHTAAQCSFQPGAQGGGGAGRVCFYSCRVQHTFPKTSLLTYRRRV